MIQLQNNKILTSGLILIISLGLFIFIVLKAGLTSMTHDESYSFLHYVPQTATQIITYETPFTNNHILNTLLMKWSASVFGTSEWSLRLPNLLAFIIYLYFGFRILQKCAPAVLFPAFILLAFNPYLLDFFGLARGYGLSIAFMTMGFYFLLAYFEKPHPGSLVWMNVGAWLAIFSNFTLLFFYASLLVLFNVTALIDRTFPNTFRHFVKINLVHFIFLVPGGILAYGPLKKILTVVPIDFGGKTGLIYDTIRSVVIMSYFGIRDFWTQVVTWGMVLLVFTLSICLIYIQLKIRDHFLPSRRSLFLVNGLILLIFLMITASHHFLDTDFPIQRFALFIFPILVLNVAFGLEILFQNAPKLAVLLGTVIVVLSVWNFSRQVNIHTYRDWAYDADTKTAITILAQDYEAHPGIKSRIHLGVSWVFEPTMNFYRLQMGLDWMAPADREGPGPGDDYLYVFRDESPRFLEAGGSVIFSSDHSPGVLIKMPNGKDPPETFR